MFSSQPPQNQSIDWASIAQSWIQLRQGDGQIITPPPPPNISFPLPGVVLSTTLPTTQIAIKEKHVLKVQEQGEADMEMDDDDDGGDVRANKYEIDNDEKPPPAPSMHIGDEKNIMQPAQTAPWYIQQTIADIVPDATLTSSESINTSTKWNARSGHSSSALTPPPTVLQTQLDGGNPTAHIPPLMKISVPNPNNINSIPSSSEDVSGTNILSASMDAAKRKMLPAWIREGLEKMERAKQKQLELEQQLKGNTSDEQQQTQISAPTKLVMVKSNAITLASDSSGNEDIDGDLVAGIHSDMDKATKVSQTTAKLHRQNSTSDDEDIGDVKSGVAIKPSGTGFPTESLPIRTYEQKLADLMIAVRRTLTELLLEVTNDEISHVATEVAKSYKSKASSHVTSVMNRKSALSSITGKLGLAAYADDVSSSDDDDDASTTCDERSPNEHSTAANDDDLEATIEMKRRAWSLIANNIEERLAENAEREERKLKYYAQAEKQQHDGQLKAERRSQLAADGGNVDYGKDFGETTERMLQHSNGNRRQRSKEHTRKERTTRFSDNKDSHLSNATTSLAYIAQQIQQQQHLSAAAPIFSPSNTMITAAPTDASQKSFNAPLHGHNVSKLLSATESTTIEKEPKPGLVDSVQPSSSRAGEKAQRREKKQRGKSRRHHHDTKSENKGGDSSTSSSGSSSTSTSTSTSDNTDNNSTSSSFSEKRKKRPKSKRGSSSSYGGNKRHGRYHDHYRQHHSSSSKRSSSTQQSSRRKRADADNSHKEKRVEHRRNHKRRHYSSDSDSDTPIRSRSRSRSSYGSSRRRKH